jgi:ParB family transcriptional regulator, chromosome partitioning protein
MTYASRPTRAVPVELIHPGRYQPRRVFDDEKLADLAESIRQKGVLQPLLVRSHPEIPHAYELVAGERRWRAAQRAQLHEVPVVVRELSDRDTLEVALVENLQREDLGPLEEAEAYVRLMEEFRHTQEELSRVVGKSRSHVANAIRLLGATERVRRYLSEGKLTAGHARTLIGSERADELADEIIARGLNVRQAEALTSRPKGRKAVSSREQVDADTAALERELAGSLGLEVQIKTKDRGGQVLIRYRTLDQLDQLLRRLR